MNKKVDTINDIFGTNEESAFNNNLISSWRIIIIKRVLKHDSHRLTPLAKKYSLFLIWLAFVFSTNVWQVEDDH